MKMIMVGWILMGVLCSSVSGAAPSETAARAAQGDKDFSQQEVNRLKEEVINKKSQILLFNYLVQKEGVQSTYPVLTLNYINDMSSRYRVDTITVTMDQERLYSYRLEDNIGKPEISRELQMFKAPVVPGSHEIFVEVVYRGNDAGIFSYLNDYRISTTGKQSIELKKGQNTKVEIVGFEKGWLLTDFKDRPDLRIKIYGANSLNPVE